jgi:DNA-binding transcriptional LysR family regulator
VDLNRVDLNLLVALDALLSERSVTSAAQRLCIGQSAMSSTLGRLRKLMNDPVFVRDGRKLVPTPLAESLQVPVRDALARLETILDMNRAFDPTLDARQFSVLGSDYVVTTFLHPLLVKLGVEAPNVRLNVRPMDDDFEDHLRRNHVDAVIVPREVFPRYTEFCHQELFCDEWVCAVDADHPDVGDTITLEEFSALPHLAISSGSRPSSAAMQMELLGIPNRTEFTVGIGAAPFLLSGTRLITLIPNRLARRYETLANLRVLAPPMQLPPITETMLWTKRNDDDPGQQWFRRSLAGVAAAIP